MFTFPAKSYSNILQNSRLYLTGDKVIFVHLVHPLTLSPAHSSTAPSARSASVCAVLIPVTPLIFMPA